MCLCLCVSCVCRKHELWSENNKLPAASVVCWLEKTVATPGVEHRITVPEAVALTVAPHVRWISCIIWRAPSECATYCGDEACVFAPPPCDYGLERQVSSAVQLFLKNNFLAKIVIFSWWPGFNALRAMIWADLHTKNYNFWRIIWNCCSKKWKIAILKYTITIDRRIDKFGNKAVYFLTLLCWKVSRKPGTYSKALHPMPPFQALWVGTEHRLLSQSWYYIEFTNILYVLFIECIALYLFRVHFDSVPTNAIITPSNYSFQWLFPCQLA